jgi:uncharacterized protein YecT (DUF1311 family)
MTTAAPIEEATLDQLDERTQEAWVAYRNSLRDLSGRDYDEAETRSWERLQRELREIEDRRMELAAAHSHSR